MSQEFPDVPPQEPVARENGVDLSFDGEGLAWERGEMLTLPDGVEVAVLNENEAEGRLDMFIRFPAGYVEPRHTHTGAHATLILDGRMLIGGRELAPGDYFYGHEVPHGPLEYPDGCTMFTSFVGGSPAHRERDGGSEA